ncbi:type VI secretion system tip protein VgrG [Leeuwenhoekiella nanhaiensis]|uniref:Type IV secretion protein Rhs n=1 Tax=Leeuwenhoekiella nanhaiensis TaxID=1655491 RepID=A0A2G1VU54_9FLAO|nr:type VI secretion system tip protein VgrG [Leeuwenhoekiella nanhaiensis]PHQ30285.1 type IV secretion protein Rhs [Leeuwenhoekiella nanhaiensis]
MNTSRSIATAQNPDLVTTTLLVNGEQLSAAYAVKSILVNREVNRIPYAQLIILDGEAASQEFELSNTDLFIPGSEIEIKAGYHSDEESIFKGIVISHGIKIRDAASALIVECKDPAVKMTVGTKSAYFYESSDSDIIEQLVANYSGLSADVEATNVTHKELVQYQTSDWDFLMLRAQANGKLGFVENGNIQIKEPNLSQEPVETVAYGATMLAFDGEIDARDQLKKITAYSWNAGDQELIETEAADANVNLNGNLSKSELSEIINLENLTLKHGGQLNTDQLQQWADAKAKIQELARNRGRVRFIGIPQVKPDTIIKLEGVGNRFNGNAYITGVRHEIADGTWTVDAQFGLEPKWFSETYNVNSQPAAGLVAAVQGLQTGIVTQLEEDPEGEDRILVNIPIIDATSEGIWARVATLDAGDSRGSFFRPEVGDEVIVGFINNDPNYAVVLGGVNSSSKPAPLAASDDNHEKGFVTRSGIKLLFNDEKSSVTIETPAGRIVVIDDDAEEIKIDDAGANSIILNTDGIEISSSADINIKASGDLNLEGTNVNIKANAEFKAEGGAGAELSTSAVAVLKGSLVQIN